MQVKIDNDRFKSDLAIINLTYLDFLDTKEAMMNLATPREIMARLKDSLEVENIEE